MLDPDALRALAATTIGHYERDPEGFWQATRDHDVTQNRAALLGAIEGAAPFRILDLGCGPGRDLAAFRALGHAPEGVDGCARFVAMAGELSGCPVSQQDFLALDLPPASFEGVFANASLFHIPGQELPRVLGELRRALKPRGVLFCSNPRGDGTEGWSGDRYGTYLDLDAWRELLERAGFDEVDHFYRPAGKPRTAQPWLAIVARRRDD